MSNRIAPEVVRQVSDHDVRQLTAAVSVIETRDEALAGELKSELDVLHVHRDMVLAFADRMRFGSSLSWHAEGVMDWLIAQGWTPPAGLLLDADTKEEA
ncbi:hypothetical protein ACUOFU_16995 [Microbacterium arabinogalactanolyticum]|uniref:hypothetical protein n=1 Tax=Microbacterium arabinogalactanolyticum TaxID=69365 RepID=UPI0040451167